MGLLDLRLQEPQRLRRLTARSAAEEQPQPRVLRFPTGLRRVAALAAMLLLAAGPIAWLVPRLQPEEGSGGLVAVLRLPDRHGGVEAMVAPAIDVRAMHLKADLPLTVDRTLQLQNTTDRNMKLWIEGPQTELRFELRGPGAVSRPAPHEPPRAEQTVTLRPGDIHTILIHNLTEEGPGPRRSWYATRPGAYTLTVRFSTVVSIPGQGERHISVRSGPVTIPVDRE